MLYSLNNTCKATTAYGSTVPTGHVKYTCGMNSAVAVYYAAMDLNCATQTSSVAVSNYGKCPTTTTTPKSVCLGTTDVSNLIKSAKGVVFT